MFIKIIQLFISLIIIIFVHEIGHFFVAKIFNFKVQRFFIFLDIYFSIFKKKIGETIYGIGWLPLGGYVKIKEMDIESYYKNKKKKKKDKSSWKKLLLSIGGIFNNFLLGFIIYFFFYKNCIYYYEDFFTTNKINYIKLDKKYKNKFKKIKNFLYYNNNKIFYKINNNKKIKLIDYYFLQNYLNFKLKKLDFYEIIYNKKKIKYIIPKKNSYSEKIGIKKGDLILRMFFKKKNIIYNKKILYFSDILYFFKKISFLKKKSNKFNNFNNFNNFIIVLDKYKRFKKIKNINFLKLKRSFFTKIKTYNIKKKKISILEALDLAFFDIKYLINKNLYLIKSFLFSNYYNIKKKFFKDCDTYYYDYNSDYDYDSDLDYDSDYDSDYNSNYYYNYYYNSHYDSQDDSQEYKDKYEKLKNSSNNHSILYLFKFFNEKLNFKKILIITANLSIYIGCFNLIPIPSFDGFYILLFSIETIINRKISKKSIYPILIITFILLNIFFLFLFLKDLYLLIFN